MWMATMFLWYVSSLTQTNSVAQEPEGSAPNSQPLATGTYTEPVESNPHLPHNIPMIHCNPIHPPTPYSFDWSGPRLRVVFRNKFRVLRWRVVNTHLIPKLDHPLSAVRDCLFNISSATLHIWRLSPLSANWRCAVPWWQSTLLTRFLSDPYYTLFDSFIFWKDKCIFFPTGRFFHKSPQHPQTKLCFCVCGFACRLCNTQTGLVIW
jgi:hypothetical protein